MKQKTSREKQVRDFFSHTYGAMKQHQKERNQGELVMTKAEFINWFFKQKNCDFLMNNWVRSECKKELRPTVQRKNNAIGYVFSNMELMTWEQNHHHQTLLTSQPVMQIDPESHEVLAIFPSMNAATRTMNTSRSHIPNAVRRGNKAAGYYWKPYDKSHF